MAKIEGWVCIRCGNPARKCLQDHVIWVYNILPPIVVDPVPAARHAREVIEPPGMMLAHIAVPPFGSSDRAHVPLEIGEIKRPVVALTEYRAGIVPIVLALAVGGKMDVAACGSAGCSQIITDETLP